MDGISLNKVKISEILGVAAPGSSAQQTRAAVSGASGQPGGKQFHFYDANDSLFLAPV